MTELEDIIIKNQRDVRQFSETGYLTEALYEALFGFYAASGEMPYGIMKARTGDPVRWVSQKFAMFIATEGTAETVAQGERKPAEMPETPSSMKGHIQCH